MAKATIKSYTDIEQSRKLVEILPTESADMWYHGHYSPWESGRKYDDEPCPFHSASPNWNKPCWSLAALLSILPSSTLDSSNDNYYRLHCKERFTEWHDNPIDACYDMIIKLNEPKLM